MRSNKKYAVEIELMAWAIKHGYPMPTDYYLAQFNIVALRNDLMKYQKVRVFNPLNERLELTKRAFECVLKPIFGVTQVLSYDQVNVKMPKSPSCGFPLNQKRISHIFGFPPGLPFFSRGEAINDPVVAVVLEDRFTAIFQGKQIIDVFQISPKIEITSALKLYIKNKQRVFMCSGMTNYQISCALYSEQNQKIVDSAGKGWSAVGTSVFYGGWHHLALRTVCSEYGGKVVGFDISGMEASLHNEIFGIIYSIRNSCLESERWSKDEIKNAAAWELTNLCFSQVIDLDGNLCVKVHGNPSGHFNTLTNNTLAVIFVLLYCATGKFSSLQDLLDFYYNYPISVVGDDSLMPDYPEFISLVLRDSPSLGFTFEKEFEACDISQAAFCNTGFRWDSVHAMYVPYPNIEKLRSSIYHYRKEKPWIYTLAKLYGIRQLSHPYKKFKDEIELDIQYCLENHWEEISSYKDEYISFGSIQPQYLSDTQLDFLWYGCENNCDELPSSLLCFQFWDSGLDNVPNFNCF